MATRRQCRNRIKKRRLSERSEFRRFPISVLAACAVRAQRGPPSSGSPFCPTFWRSKKRVGCRAEYPACLHGSEAALLHPPGRRGMSALRRCATVRQRQRPRRLRGSRSLADEAMRHGLPDDQAGSRPGSRPTSLASSREVGKRRRPRRWRPAGAGSPRRWHRNREASATRFAQTADASYPISAPATWRHQRGFTSKAASKATATATVAARSHRQRQGSLRGQLPPRCSFTCLQGWCNKQGAFHHG